MRDWDDEDVNDEDDGDADDVGDDEDHEGDELDDRCGFQVRRSQTAAGWADQRLRQTTTDTDSERDW